MNQEKQKTIEDGFKALAEVLYDKLEKCIFQKQGEGRDVYLRQMQYMARGLKSLLELGIISRSAYDSIYQDYLLKTSVMINEFVEKEKPIGAI